MERPASKQLKKRSLSSSEPLPRAKKLKQKQKTSNRPRAYDESPPASASSEDDGDGSASEEEDEEARREAMIAALEAHQRALLADSLPSIAHRAAVQARKADTKSVWELDADDFEDDDDDEGDSSSEGDEEDGEPVASTSAAAGPLVVSFEEPRGAATAGTQRDMQAFMSAKVKNARPTFSVADLVNIKPFSHRQRTAKPSFADEEAESHLASLDASLSTLIRPLSQPSSLSTHSQLPSLLQSLPMAPTKLLKGLTPLPGNAPRTLRRGQEAANLKRARARDESAGVLAGAKKGREATSLKEKRREEGGDKRQRGMNGAMGKMTRGGLVLSKEEVERGMMSGPSSGRGGAKGGRGGGRGASSRGGGSRGGGGGRGRGRGK